MVGGKCTTWLFWLYLVGIDHGVQPSVRIANSMDCYSLREFFKSEFVGIKSLPLDFPTVNDTYHLLWAM
jgi:hypothetical protein